MSDFKSFMLSGLKNDNTEILTFKGVDTFKDSEGNPIPLKFKKLTEKEVEKLRKEFTTRTPAVDKNGKYIIRNGRIINDIETDLDSFSDAIIAESMVYPDLKDKSLYDYYNVYSKIELLNVLFKGDDYKYVDSCAAQACGMSPIDEDELVKELKN